MGIGSLKQTQILKIAGFLSVTHICAQESPKFISTDIQDPDPSQILRLQDKLAFGVHTQSVIPSSRPFSASGGTEFDFQTNNAFGIDLIYSYKSNLDVGLSFSLEGYESNLKVGSSSTEIRTAKTKSFPTAAYVRWKNPKKLWSPEAEAGLGFSINNLDIESTNLSDPKVEDSFGSFFAYGGLGVSIAWTQHVSLGALVGYRQVLSSSKTYDAGAFNVSYKASSGVNAKASLRYHF